MNDNVCKLKTNLNLFKQSQQIVFKRVVTMVTRKFARHVIINCNMILSYDSH